MTKKNEKPHFHVTAGLIRMKGKLLITRRPKGTHLEGLWEFPGGKQERGETLRESLERELREELGLVARAEKLLYQVDHEYGDRIISLYLFQCSHITGQLKSLEGQEIKWVPLEDLDKYPFPPPDYQFICYLQRK